MHAACSSLSIALAIALSLPGSCDCGNGGQQPNVVKPAPQPAAAKAASDELRDAPDKGPSQQGTTEELPQGKDPGAASLGDDEAARQLEETRRPEGESTGVSAPARGLSPASQRREPADKPSPTSSKTSGSAPSRAAEAREGPKRGTVIPSTSYVSAEVPKGLRALLDADSRMQPWVTEVMRVADKCYARERARNPFAKGVIAVKVTMHPNARPSAAIQSLPPLLAGVVACATSELTSTKMPLFTGPEGAKYTVKISFKR